MEKRTKIPIVCYKLVNVIAPFFDFEIHTFSNFIAHKNEN